MSFKTWLEQLAPDFVATYKRFSFAILLAAITTTITLGSINEIVWLWDQVWFRAIGGVATGAVFSVAGTLFAESRPEARRAGLLLTYGLPILPIVAFQVYDPTWLTPFALPVVAVLWLSVSPFMRITTGEAREVAQNRFWWLNHQAITTAVIAATGFLIICLGIAAIERSLSMLFGLSSGDIFYRWVLPFTGLFLTPVYWLSTLPKLSEYDPKYLEQPEFISRAIGFLGQFVLAPLLLIYGLILLAYTGQIIITQQLPQGMIGWMVLGFVVIGAANWLVLHPPFMRLKPLVKFFRRWWFWLTLVPLALFFFAVWVRLDTYGLTAERMLLLAGGLWAAVIAIIFLLRRGDIRMIPALAGLILLALSVGPWNFVNLPVQQQAMRLDTLLMQPGENGASFPPKWTPEELEAARGSIDFLAATIEGRNRLAALVRPYGVAFEPSVDTSYSLLAKLGYGDGGVSDPIRTSLYRDMVRQPVDVSATPRCVRPVTFYVDTVLDFVDMRLELNQGTLWIFAPAAARLTGTSVDLDDWAASQGENGIAAPWIDFAFEGANYRLAVDMLELSRVAAAPATVSQLGGMLFTDRITPTP